MSHEDSAVSGHAGEHGHDHDHGADQHAAFHNADTPRARRLPSPEMAARGVGLGALAVAAGWGAVSILRASVLLAPVSLGLGVSALLALWGAAIHLTGGEKFDDHPYV
ncbi:MAG TPA: hypothetical protein PKK39_05675 [Tepidiformaceae bacterium]|nr:hypothetical protein [Tepidiformaceae bacterium]